MGVSAPVRFSSKQIGIALVDQGLITPEQLQSAESSQQSRGGNLAHILLKKGILQEKEIRHFYQNHFGITHINLEEYHQKHGFDRSLLRFVPYQVAKKYNVIPFEILQDRLRLAVVDLFHTEELTEILSCEGMALEFVLAGREDIDQLIRLHHSVQKMTPSHQVEILQEGAAKIKTNIEKSAELGPHLSATETINSILESAFQDKSSDIHIEPMENFVRVRFRVDGVLEEKYLLHDKVLQPMVSRLKILSGMNIAERRAPQDGRFSVKIHGKLLDCRTSIYPTVHGEKVVIRLLSKKSLVKLEQLGMSSVHQEAFRSCILKPHGLLLVTGPTGSGKSTTLYAGLQLLNSIDRNIMSIEDPVENEIAGVNQAQLNKKAKMTFASALKSMLRQDPDVIMVGEIRDAETAEMSIRAALTGHLVLSTLHTNEAIGAVTRLSNLGVPPFLIGSCLVGALGQRLVRRICQKCRIPQTPGQGEDPRLLGLAPETILYHGKGCEACRYTGYDGRLGLFDLVVLNHSLKKLIERDAPEEQLKIEASNNSWQPMIADGKEKVCQGLTTISEVLKVNEFDE